VQWVIFETRKDEIDGAFVTTCPGHSIVTQAGSVEKLREMIKDAVHCHFRDGAAGEMPHLIRLHFVRDEVLIA
jgi:predicted RNase H-like HicB family nuclease